MQDSAVVHCGTMHTNYPLFATVHTTTQSIISSVPLVLTARPQPRPVNPAQDSCGARLVKIIPALTGPRGPAARGKPRSVWLGLRQFKILDTLGIFCRQNGWFRITVAFLGGCLQECWWFLWWYPCLLVMVSNIWHKNTNMVFGKSDIIPSPYKFHLT